jgi:hypothetical protein
VPRQNSRNLSELVFLCSSGCSPVLADQAVDDGGVRNPVSHIDRLAGLVQRRSLLARLVRPMLVVNAAHTRPDPPEILFAVDQQVVEALAPALVMFVSLLVLVGDSAGIE